PVATLYFHPWEFDPEQARLPLGCVSRFRTYVGIRHSRGRLTTLLGRHRFARAIDVAKWLDQRRAALPCYGLLSWGVGSPLRHPWVILWSGEPPGLPWRFSRRGQTPPPAGPGKSQRLPSPRVSGARLGGVRRRLAAKRPLSLVRSPVDLRMTQDQAQVSRTRSVNV